MAPRVQKLLGINEMREATNTTDLGLINDIANVLARHERQKANMLTEMYRSQTRLQRLPRLLR